MNVRLDYRHIHYWQQALASSDRQSSTELQPQAKNEQGRPEARYALQTRSSNGRSKSLLCP